MGARGPKPKPAPIKLLEGTRADRAGPAGTTAVPGLPECPEHLDPVAREEWRRIVPDLERMGILSRTDGAALALYCDTFSEWVRARAEVEVHGTLIETGMGGLKANPAVAIARQARAQMHRLLAEFGCTPSSRSRINAGIEDRPKDAFAEFMSRRKA